MFYWLELSLRRYVKEISPTFKMMLHENYLSPLVTIFREDASEYVGNISARQFDQLKK